MKNLEYNIMKNVNSYHSFNEDKIGHSIIERIKLVQFIQLYRMESYSKKVLSLDDKLLNFHLLKLKLSKDELLKAVGDL